MEIVEHSRCKECNRILPLEKLDKNNNGVGMVCIDKEECKKQVAKSVTAQIK
jgi:hypothetical protein